MRILLFVILLVWSKSIEAGSGPSLCWSNSNEGSRTPSRPWSNSNSTESIPSSLWSSSISSGSIISSLWSNSIAADTIPSPPQNDNIISFIVDPQKQDVKLYWKNDSGQIFRSIQNLKTFLERKNRRLIFAMNGGMYTTENSPLGLYIENSKTITQLNTRSGSGNFYLKPNGVFYISKDNKPGICVTAEFPKVAATLTKSTAALLKVATPSSKKTSIKFATQSGPMLLVNGKINDAFKDGSLNLNIRNGVGILPGNRILFAMSKWPVNFYDFAEFFKSQGCKDALYLDGAISRTYLPEKNWVQTGGDFGVMIGISTPR